MKPLLIEFTQLEEPKPWELVDLLRKISGVNTLFDQPELISYQPL
jgi:hypothetical protein